MSQDIVSQADTGSDPRKTKLGIRQQLVLSAYWFATNMHWGAMLLLLIPYQAKIIAPNDWVAAMSLTFGLGSVVALVIPLIAGALSDRSMSKWGRRRPFLVFGVAFNLIGLAVMAYGGGRVSLPLYVIGYLIVQFGNNTAGAAYAGIIPDMVPEDQRGAASGYMATMTQLGTILGVITCQILLGSQYAVNKATGHNGQFYVYIVYAIIALVMLVFLILTVLTVHETPLTEPLPPLTLRKFVRDIIEPLKFPDFFWVLVTRALVTLGMWIIQPYIQNYVEDVVHVDNPPEKGAMLLLVILLTATATGLIGGKLSDSIGRKRVVYMANTLLAVCAVAFLFSHSMTYTFVIGALFGIGYGAYTSVDWALACDVLPNPEDAGKDMAIWHISLVIPQTFAPALAGLLLARFGTVTNVPVFNDVTHKMDQVAHYSVSGYEAAFWAAAVFLVLGALFLRNVRERTEQKSS